MDKAIGSAEKLPLNILQIGCGSFGAHLNTHLIARVDKVETTTRRDLSSFDLKSFDYVFLATKDSSLKDMTGKVHQGDKNAKIIHFSGAQYFPESLGLHPVASFNRSTDYDLDQITFVADGELDANLKIIFKIHQRIAPAKKQDYHNFLSVAANALQLIVHDLGVDFEDHLDLDPNLLKGIVIQSLEVERSKGELSFSGPWVRDEKIRQDETVALMKSTSLKNLNELFKKEIEIYKSKKMGS